LLCSISKRFKGTLTGRRWRAGIAAKEHAEAPRAFYDPDTLDTYGHLFLAGDEGAELKAVERTLMALGTRLSGVSA